MIHRNVHTLEVACYRTDKRLTGCRGFADSVTDSAASHQVPRVNKKKKKKRCGWGELNLEFVTYCERLLASSSWTYLAIAVSFAYSGRAGNAVNELSPNGTILRSSSTVNGTGGE